MMPRPSSKTVGTCVLYVAYIACTYSMTAHGQNKPAFVQYASATLTIQPSTMDEHQRLKRAISELLTVRHVRDGRVVLIAHCTVAKGGCMHRIDEYTDLFITTARRYGIDPWLLLTVAYRESGLNPEARGPMGELGVMQLHPYSRWGMRARKVCDASPSACTATVVDVAAQYLAQNIVRCKDTASALGAYNTGRCQVTRYSKRALDLRDKIESLSKGASS